MMGMRERAVGFSCGGFRLVGIISEPSAPVSRGVLVVVGGPQYRVGSHRQFTLLCRTLAQSGVPAMRFDYRGMGDSEGNARTFEDIDADIRAAIDQFVTVAKLKEVVIWGLCDAASAALLYAPGDPRVKGLVLLNPWVRTVESEAKAYVQHYYGRRLVSAAFWKKVASGEFEIKQAFVSLLQTLVRASGVDRSMSKTTVESLPDRMLEGLRRFKGSLLLILSGNDLTAQEFNDLVSASSIWQELLSRPQVTRRSLPAANHTFSSGEWRDQVASWTVDWVAKTI